MRRTELSWEPWASFQRDFIPLVRHHYHEVEGELAQRRPFKPSLESMAQLEKAGILHCLAGRWENELVGYLTWNVVLDIESCDHTIAMQGAWYVDPRFRSSSLGFKLFRESESYLRDLGCSFAFLHHRLLGGGSGIDKFFRRRGAIATQVTYMLDLKPENKNA